jgi:hypothetical protein
MKFKINLGKKSLTRITPIIIFILFIAIIIIIPSSIKSDYISVKLKVEDPSIIKDHWSRKITVYSDDGKHYYNVPVSITIPENLVDVELYRYISSDLMMKVTDRPEYGFQVVDLDDNDLKDTVKWVVPELSEVSFSVEGKLTSDNTPILQYDEQITTTTQSGNTQTSKKNGTLVKAASSWDPGNTNPMGIELNSTSNVWHMWNENNDYYMNKTSGIQITNHYQEYWTHNVFCAWIYLGETKLYNITPTTADRQSIDLAYGSCVATSLDTDNAVYCGNTLGIDRNEWGYVNSTHSSIIPSDATITNVTICWSGYFETGTNDNANDGSYVRVGENSTGSWVYTNVASCIGTACNFNTDTTRCYDVTNIINTPAKAGHVRISLYHSEGDDNNMDIFDDYNYVNITYSRWIRRCSDVFNWGCPVCGWTNSTDNQTYAELNGTTYYEEGEYKVYFKIRYYLHSNADRINITIGVRNVGKNITDSYVGWIVEHIRINMTEENDWGMGYDLINNPHYYNLSADLDESFDETQMTRYYRLFDNETISELLFADLWWDEYGWKDKKDGLGWQESNIPFQLILNHTMFPSQYNTPVVLKMRAGQLNNTWEAMTNFWWVDGPARYYDFGAMYISNKTTLRISPNNNVTIQCIVEQKTSTYSSGIETGSQYYQNTTSGGYTNIPNGTTMTANDIWINGTNPDTHAKDSVSSITNHTLPAHNITFKVPGTYYVRCEENDAASNDVEIIPTDALTVTVKGLINFTSPTNNNSYARPNDPVNFTMNTGTNDDDLSGYIFSSNFTDGTWRNSSWVALAGTQTTASMWNTTTSTTVGNYAWKFYVNTSSNIWNVSDLQSFTFATRTLLVNWTVGSQINSTCTESSPCQFNQNSIFNANATVNCSTNPAGQSCDSISGSIRYNDTTATPNKTINTTTGATPFYIVGGGGYSEMLPTYAINSTADVTVKVNGSDDNYAKEKIYGNLFSCTSPYIYVNFTNSTIFNYVTVEGNYSTQVSMASNYGRADCYNGAGWTNIISLDYLTESNKSASISSCSNADGNYTFRIYCGGTPLSSPGPCGCNLTVDYVFLNGTGSASNPTSCSSLTNGQSCQLNWTVNYTGTTPYKINVNFTSSNSNVAENSTTNATVKITSAAPGNWVGINLSTALQRGIFFGSRSVNTTDIMAQNDSTGTGNVTEYWIGNDPSSSGNVTLWHYAADMTRGSVTTDKILIGNVTNHANQTANGVNVNMTQWKTSTSVALTTSWTRIGNVTGQTAPCDNLQNGSVCYVAYWLDVPSGISGGTYNTTYKYCGNLTTTSVSCDG